ncbi:unnamed protein product [Macrosiphum euphorbiae]|uniref:Uncharacterized protein n=1 Tax=Macrosiphum euphorbiae TaxID=13131 RepID=A0AAV0WWD7_9HEMI|nr:unnamed protein product [Macrosiphum euphorbiae]
MCMVLKTFKLSKNPLVQLLYLILIVTTVSNQADEESAGPIRVQTDENINNVAKGTDPISSSVDKGSTINGEDPKLDDEDDPFRTMTLDLPESTTPEDLKPKGSTINGKDPKLDDEDDPFSTMTLDLPESTTSEDLKPEETELEARNDQNIKGADPIPSNVEKGSTTNIGMIEQNKNMIKGFLSGLNARNSINQPNKNEINDIKNNIDVTDDKIEDEKLVVEDDSTTPGDLKPEEKELEAQNNLNIEGTDPIPSNVDKGSTINDESMEQKKNTIKGIFDRINSRNSINQPNKNEINDIDLKENNIDVTDDKIEDEKLVVEDDSTTPGDLKLEEKELEAQNNLNIEDGIISSKKKKSQGSPQDTQGPPQDTQGSPQDNQAPPQDTQDTPHPLKPINPEDLTLSSLENVKIVKIKQFDPVAEESRKKKKRNIFKEFAPTEGNARIYCTFLGDVLKMYKKVKKRFIGHFCHAIVFGAPIILKNHRVHLSENTRNQLLGIHEHKQLSLVIVIMQFSNYKYWVHALRNNRGMKNLIIDIIHTAVHYKIDGIQFSNLHPTRETDEVNTHMMNNLIRFFERLELAAKAKNHDLKIGITIDMHGLSITKSFTSFKHLNSLVTWYSFKTISMVKCSSEYKAIGTSPLEGNMGFKNTINTLIEQINSNNEFDMTKLVVGIQLFPNKKIGSEPSTYEEFCSDPKDKWDEWCAARPKDFQAKGRFLRSTQIGGLQLYYMHSDDYRSTCGCYSFPLIRALLRGLIKVDTPETCDFETAHN